MSVRTSLTTAGSLHNASKSLAYNPFVVNINNEQLKNFFLKLNLGMILSTSPGQQNLLVWYENADQNRLI